MIQLDEGNHIFSTNFVLMMAFSNKTVGIPDPRKDHASAMVQFAHDCLLKMNDAVHALETALG